MVTLFASNILIEERQSTRNTLQPQFLRDAFVNHARTASRVNEQLPMIEIADATVDHDEVAFIKVERYILRSLFRAAWSSDRHHKPARPACIAARPELSNTRDVFAGLRSDGYIGCPPDRR